jgi:hypothetical protein
MCDTLCKQVQGQNFFAKNSDRDYGEPQYIHYTSIESKYFDTIPEYKYTYQEISLPLLLKLKAEYRCTIPALISRPSWIWGAEMGINVYGVAIGNEAVFTLRPASKRGILGMDLLRLALHNATTALEALQLLCTWTENVPQGGNGSYVSSLYYNNSFIIKDAKEAYILETAGYKYVWKKVSDSEALSNCYALDVADASNMTKLSMRTYASPFHAYFSKGKYRRNLNTNFLADTINLSMLMKQMRSHGHTDTMHTSMKGICLHAKGIATTTTTASWIIDYNTVSPIIWYMPHAHPCVGKYLPIPLVESELLKYENCHTQLDFHLKSNRETEDYVHLYGNFKAILQSKFAEEQSTLIAAINKKYLLL